MGYTHGYITFRNIVDFGIFVKVLDEIDYLLKDNGVFIIEVHYLKSLIETNQYDTIYHEHMRYYSLQSLDYLLKTKNFRIFHAKLAKLI